VFSSLSVWQSYRQVRVSRAFDLTLLIGPTVLLDRYITDPILFTARPAGMAKAESPTKRRAMRELK
jgi:hypothetical protein